MSWVLRDHPPTVRGHQKPKRITNEEYIVSQKRINVNRKI